MATNGLRILHIDTGREMRGGQRQALLLMRGLREMGQASELLARRASPLWEAAVALGFPVHSAGLASVRQYSAEADLVHVHDARAHTLAAIASGAPFVVSRRVAFPLKKGFPSRWKYARAGRYLAVSQFVACELERAGVAARKIDVVYDGVELTSCPVRSEAAKFLVVAIDSRDPGKGRSLVEEATAIAQVPVVLSADLSRDLRDASVFLYITESEGLGSAALLAMSFEVPVIASRVGGLPEIVGEGACGLLVENDPEAIAQCILRMKTDPALARGMGRNGRSLVEQKFTVERMVEHTLEAYRRVVSA